MLPGQPVWRVLIRSLPGDAVNSLLKGIAAHLGIAAGAWDVVVLGEIHILVCWF